MVDTKDCEYSRAPTLDDVIQLCESLNKHGIRYVLIGGVAVILHGYTRGTTDIDLLVDSAEENVAKIKEALAYLPDNAVAAIKNNEVKKYSVVRIGDEIVIDLMEKACGVNYEEASKDIMKKEINGVLIPLASPEMLIRMKDTVRHKDKVDIEFLQTLAKNKK